eukprot:TRINITY_DN12654_c2_g1_i13.p1 TRINITY_DN12654_c2_g1~~TRINITY_DN12654_c2_g1_i13.p1  ORF type:complete len:173 (+),score=40.93 TRINITY_DN12654_c2_g1_i13:293-811(+)
MRRTVWLELVQPCSKPPLDVGDSLTLNQWLRAMVQGQLSTDCHHLFPWLWQCLIRTTDAAISPMVFNSSASIPTATTELGTTMTPVRAPELSSLVGMDADELAAQLEAVAISNEMLRQSAKETETQMAEINHHVTTAVAIKEQLQQKVESLQQMLVATQASYDQALPESRRP